MSKQNKKATKEVTRYDFEYSLNTKPAIFRS